MENGGNGKLIWRGCKQKRATKRTYERHVRVLQMRVTTIGGEHHALNCFFLLARETKYGTESCLQK